MAYGMTQKRMNPASEITSDGKEFFATKLTIIFAQCGQIRKTLFDRLPCQRKNPFPVAMSTAERFRDDAVDDLKLQQILRRDLHVGCRILRPRRIAPENGCCTFR